MGIGWVVGSPDGWERGGTPTICPRAGAIPLFFDRTSLTIVMRLSLRNGAPARTLTGLVVGQS
jgi:hypothetical protein